jgi:hypothetical protein
MWICSALYNRPIRNKNCLWRPCLLTDRNEMSNLYRRPSIVASYQVSFTFLFSPLKRLNQMKWNLVGSIYGRSSVTITHLEQQIPILYSFVWQDRSSYPQSIALEASTLTITLPMRFPIFILFLLGERAKTGWLGIRIMCPSGATHLPNDC